MIDKNNKLYICRVCGLEQKEPPWGIDEKTPSFDICDCCGVEFGYEDAKLTSIRRYRTKWLSGGAIWFDSKLKPENWNLEKQLEQIPPEYL